MGVVVKNAEEIVKMRRAGFCAAQTLEMIGEFIRAGVATDELNSVCHNYIVDQLGCIPAPLNYRGFPKSICTSVNHQVCHGIPGARKLQDGDIINIDVTVIKDGFHGDTSKMFSVGRPRPSSQLLNQAAYDALRLGIEEVKPGKTLGDIGHVIEVFARKKHLGVVREYCGHGIGREFHEEPHVLHYGKPNTGIELVEGMTFTIEPMLNLGGEGVRMLPDGWTVVTRDHSLSAQWEHTLLVTAKGVEVLTKRTNEDF